MQSKLAMQEPKDPKASLLLVSAPEHVLLKAKALIEKRGGYCAAFTQFDSRSPQTMSVIEAPPKKRKLCQDVGFTE